MDAVEKLRAESGLVSAAWLESLSSAYATKAALLLDQGCTREACAALRAVLKLSPDSQTALECQLGAVRCLPSR